MFAFSPTPDLLVNAVRGERCGSRVTKALNRPAIRGKTLSLCDELAAVVRSVSGHYRYRGGVIALAAVQVHYEPIFDGRPYAAFPSPTFFSGLDWRQRSLNRSASQPPAEWVLGHLSCPLVTAPDVATGDGC